MTTSTQGVNNDSNFSHLFTDRKDEKKTTSRFQLLSFAKCQNLWSYCGKINGITRNLLNASSRSRPIVGLIGKNYVGLVRDVTTHMKLLSIMSVIFSGNEISSLAEKTFKGFSHRDKEAVILGTISFTVIAADMIDSLTTFINTSFTVILANPIATLSAISLPLAYIIFGFGTISKTIQIAKTAKLYIKIDHEILSKNDLSKDYIKKILEETLGIDEELKNLLSIPQDELNQEQQKKIEQLKEKNKAAILRSAPKDAVEDLEKLLILLEKNSFDETLSKEQLDCIFKTLENVQLELKKKIKGDTLGLVANLFSLAAIALLTVGSVSFWPFLLFALALCIKLGVVIYQNQKIKKNNLEAL